MHVTNFCNHTCVYSKSWYFWTDFIFAYYTKWSSDFKFSIFLSRSSIFANRRSVSTEIDALDAISTSKTDINFANPDLKNGWYRMYRIKLIVIRATTWNHYDLPDRFACLFGFFNSVWKNWIILPTARMDTNRWLNLKFRNSKNENDFMIIVNNLLI